MFKLKKLPVNSDEAFNDQFHYYTICICLQKKENMQGQVGVPVYDICCEAYRTYSCITICLPEKIYHTTAYYTSVDKTKQCKVEFYCYLATETNNKNSSLASCSRASYVILKETSILKEYVVSGLYTAKISKLHSFLFNWIGAYSNFSLRLKNIFKKGHNLVHR